MTGLPPAPHWHMTDVFPSFAADMGFRPGDTAGAERTLVGFNDDRVYPSITARTGVAATATTRTLAMLGGNAVRVLAACWG